MAGTRVPVVAPAAAEPAKAKGARRGAHFAFTHFATAQARQAIDWREASLEIARSLGIEHVAPPAGEGVVVGWRLITENNRELARSFKLFRDESEARGDAMRVRAQADDLESHVLVTAQVRGAGWCSTLDESPVVIGARRYENRSAARGAAELALRLLSLAAREPASRSPQNP